MASARPSRRLVPRTPTAGAVAALALAGCSATNPITTAEPYNVVDGVQETLTDTVAVQNLLVVTSAQGEPGVMVGAVRNESREDVEVTLQIDGGGSVTVEVPARGTVLLGGDGEEVEIESVGVAPGALLTVTASTSGGGDVPIQVPVFDDALPEYAQIVPDPGA